MTGADKLPRWLSDAIRQLRARSPEAVLRAHEESPGYSIAPSQLAPLVRAAVAVLRLRVDPVQVLKEIARLEHGRGRHAGGRPRTRGSGDDCLRRYPMLVVLTAMTKAARSGRDPSAAARLAIAELGQKYPASDLTWLSDEAVAHCARLATDAYGASRKDDRPLYPRQAAITLLNSLPGWGQIPDRTQKLCDASWSREEQAFRTHPLIRPPKSASLPNPKPRGFGPFQLAAVFSEAADACRRRADANAKATLRIRPRHS